MQINPICEDLGGHKVKKQTLTESFTSGKTAPDTNLSAITILTAELLGNVIISIPAVSGGVKTGYAFVALNSNMAVDTGVNGSKTVTITYIEEQ